MSHPTQSRRATSTLTPRTFYPPFLSPSLSLSLDAVKTIERDSARVSRQDIVSNEYANHERELEKEHPRKALPSSTTSPCHIVVIVNVEFYRAEAGGSVVISIGFVRARKKEEEE